MATFETIKAKLETLLNGVNEETGASDANLTSAVARMRNEFTDLKSSTEDNLVSVSNLISEHGEASFAYIHTMLSTLINESNHITGESDATLTDAVGRLHEGYGRVPATADLYVTENGSYFPSDGVDGFYEVNVNVSDSGVELPTISPGTEAEPSDVRNMKQYIDQYGNLCEGTMPEQSSSSVTVHTDNTKNFSVSFPAGYYPDDVSVSGAVGYTGGDATIFLRSENLAAGAYVFRGLDTGIFPTLTQNLALCLTIFYSLFQSVIGSGYYYMPANIMLVLDSIVFFNGAFYAQSVDMGSTTQVAYSGSDVTGAYRLDMVLESSAAGDKLLSISLANNGEAVDTSGGLRANIYFTLPIFD